MSKFKFIVVSKDLNVSMALSLFEALGLESKFIVDNSEPLTTIYNRELVLFRATADIQLSFLIFIHADVKLDICAFIQHIELCKDKYDVMGLCGCSKINVSLSPLNWYCGSRPYPEERWGCVIHGELGNACSFFSVHHPEVLDHEVACIDGLCIIFGPKALATDMLFDETFKFDLYDTDISFLTILKYQLKLGVLVTKDLQHYSVGKSILTADFLKHENDFRKKWKILLN